MFTSTFSVSDDVVKEVLLLPLSFHAEREEGGG